MLLLLLTTPAFAEGTASLGATQRLAPETVLRVDVLDASTESFTWTAYDAEGTPYGATVEDPTGTPMGRIESGDTVVPTVAGAWTIHPDATTPIYYWDVTVDGAAAGFGRLWSSAWHLDTGGFSEELAANTSFYSKVEGGGSNSAVIELRAAGLSGNVYTLKTSDVGVLGANGRSILIADAPGAAPAQHAIYLDPPEDSNYTASAPSVAGAAFDSNGAGDCVSAGVVGGEFTFNVDRDSAYHIGCDLDGDGTADPSDDADLQISGRATTGPNSVSWDGTDNLGNPVAPGTYTCRIVLTQGELHFVSEDIETSYEGFRLFLVDASLERTGLAMYWNDADVQGYEARPLPDGDTALENSGARGVSSGDYTDPTQPNRNARTWGDFPETGDGTKGDLTYLDTYTWLFEDVSVPLTIEVADPLADGDGDRLSDADESCLHGTDPTLPDTDDDGLGDYDEALVLPTDPVNPDSDDDLVPDGVEVGDVDAPTDTDGDGVIDALDEDDDGDTLLTRDEDVDGNGDPTNDDTDADGIANYLDPFEDVDGDGFSTADDCDDSRADVYPGAPELPDGIDNDCDGKAEAGDTGDTGRTDTAMTDTAGVDSGVDSGDTGKTSRECGCRTGAPAPMGLGALLLLALTRRRRLSDV